MSEPLFRIENCYGAESGDAPIISNGDATKYVGYFTGSEGDQLVFVFDRVLKRGELRCGEAGWNEVIEVRNGVPVGYEMYFGNAERLWLAACWAAAMESDVIPSACVPRVRFMCGSTIPHSPSF